MIAYRFLKQWPELDLLLLLCLFVGRNLHLVKVESYLGESRVLSANLSSCFRRSFMMRRAWSMGMVV